MDDDDDDDDDDGESLIRDHHSPQKPETKRRLLTSHMRLLVFGFRLLGPLDS